MNTRVGTVTSQNGYVIALSNEYDGPSADEILAALEQDGFEDIRAAVFWNGVVARPDSCFVSLALEYLDLVQMESCGRCTPCRIGTERMRKILRRILEGAGSELDIERLKSMAEEVNDSAWCGIADTLGPPLRGLLEAGEADFRAHLQGSAACRGAEEVHGWVTAPCRSTCPSTVDCPWYIFQAAEGHPHISADVVRQDNPLPAIIGRTCHHPCEGACTLRAVDQPIAINFIKRWSADHEEGLRDTSHDRGHVELTPAGLTRSEQFGMGPDEAAEVKAVAAIRGTPSSAGANRQPVAIVGAGPAGLAAAYYLGRNGYRPVVFEALPVPGGMVWVGIPQYRLPKDVIRREVELIEQAGAEIRYNTKVGVDIGFNEIMEEFPACFIAVGAHKGRRLRIPGEDLAGSMDAIDFLRRVALGGDPGIGERVLVIGGGNSAMDAARTSLRLGAKEVTVVYRRAREQMPANPWEIEEAEEEGVDFRLLASPVECAGDSCVTGLVCQPMELGPPDESGRRRPVPVECDPFHVEADTVIAAVGQSPDFSPFADFPGLELNEWGYLEADAHTFMTTRPGVFVGGDAVSGGASVIEAIFAGKRAAKYMDRFLQGLPVAEDLPDKTQRLAVALGARESQYRLAGGIDYGCRQQMPMLPPDYRRTNFEHTELGFSDSQAREEARRCLRCHRPIVVAR
ncbi:MAG: hypothetical protein Kow00129_01550 [Thermoleophilia bacterium]